MDKIKNLLKAREKQLLKLKKEKEKALRSVPEGTLRICSHKGKTQYYHRTDPKDCNGVYIKEKDINLVRKLAQKDYDKKVLSSIEKELSAIEKYNSNSPLRSVEQIYASLHKERQKMIIPIIESDEDYIRDWESKEYQGKGFYSESMDYFTAKGERVRSKSEVIIADTLNREGIPYRYEHPIYLECMGEVYPDFTVLNISERKEIIWEHLGIMDDAEYAEKAVQKIIAYEQNGYKHPLNQKIIMLNIKHFLK